MKRLLLALMGLLLVSPSWAAVTANSIVTAQTPNRGLQQFLNASTPGTYGAVYTAGANGSKCNAFWVDNNDPSATHVITCQIVNGGTKYGGFSLTTVSPAGATSFNQATLLPATTVVGGDSDGNPYLQLINGDTLQCTFATTITSGDQVDIHAQCSDF